MDNILKAGGVIGSLAGILEVFGKDSILSKKGKYLVLGGVLILAVLLTEKKIKL